MKRYLSSAIFEGVEVADSDFEDLTALRETETSDVKYAIWDFDTDVDALVASRTEDLASLRIETQAAFDECSATYSTRIDVIAAIPIGFIFTPEYIRYLSAIAYDEYHNCIDKVTAQSNEEADAIISEADSEYSELLTHRTNTIDYINESTLSQINEIIAARYFLPAYMINNKPGACDFCITLNKVVGTLQVLIKKRYIPPFHYHCRCFLTQAGYVVMSGTTPFAISELLLEASYELGGGVSPSSLIPSIHPTIEPRTEEGMKNWLAQIAAWWAFWNTYYPIPTEPMYVLHD